MAPSVVQLINWLTYRAPSVKNSHNTIFCAICFISFQHRTKELPATLAHKQETDKRPLRNKKPVHQTVSVGNQAIIIFFLFIDLLNFNYTEGRTLPHQLQPYWNLYQQVLIYNSTTVYVSSHWQVIFLIFTFKIPLYFRTTFVRNYLVHGILKDSGIVSKQ